jgi:hypothetical protein
VHQSVGFGGDLFFEFVEVLAMGLKCQWPYGTDRRVVHHA